MDSVFCWILIFITTLISRCAHSTSTYYYHLRLQIGAQSCGGVVFRLATNGAILTLDTTLPQNFDADGQAFLGTREYLYVIETTTPVFPVVEINLATESSCTSGNSIVTMEVWSITDSGSFTSGTLFTIDAGTVDQYSLYMFPSRSYTQAGFSLCQGHMMELYVKTGIVGVTSGGYVTISLTGTLANIEKFWLRPGGFPSSSTQMYNIFETQNIGALTTIEIYLYEAGVTWNLLEIDIQDKVNGIRYVCSTPVGLSHTQSTTYIVTIDCAVTTIAAECSTGISPPQGGAAATSAAITTVPEETTTVTTTTQAETTTITTTTTPAETTTITTTTTPAETTTITTTTPAETTITTATPAETTTITTSTTAETTTITTTTPAGTTTITTTTPARPTTVTTTLPEEPTTVITTVPEEPTTVITTIQEEPTTVITAIPEETTASSTPDETTTASGILTADNKFSTTQHHSANTRYTVTAGDASSLLTVSDNINDETHSSVTATEYQVAVTQSGLVSGNVTAPTLITPTSPTGCAPVTDISKANRVGDGSDFYNKVTFSCFPYYKLHDGSTSVTSECQTSGLWEPPLPVGCHRFLCPDLLDLYGPGFVNTSSKSEGAHVLFKCKRGYTMSNGRHSQVTRCSGSSWRPKLTSCQVIVCDEFEVVNAYIHFIATDVGHVAEIACNHGYTFTDGSVRRSAYCRSDRKWTSIPECIARTCVSPKSSTLHKEGDIKRYTCPDGQTVDNGQPNKTLQCSSLGRWSSAYIPCSASFCPTPLLLPHASVTSDHVTRSVTYTCLPGYRYADGEKSYTMPCDMHLQQETVSRGHIQCLDVTCPPTPDANFTTQNTTLALYGTKVNYSCFHGYHVPGNSASNITEQVITCQDTGNWSQSPKSCELTICENIAFENVTVEPEVYNLTVDTYVTLVCPAGLRFIDGHTSKDIACLVDGKWSQLVSNCSANRCPPVADLRYANPDTVFTNFGMNVTYTCWTGYEFPGGYTKLTMRCDPSTGQWSTFLPDCEIIECPFLPALDTVEYSDATSVTYGTEIDVLCLEGFFLPYNAANATQTTCLANHTWSPPVDDCIGIECPFLTPPVYATYNTYENKFRTQVTVTCAQGFSLYNRSIKTTGNIRCNSKAQWEGDPLDCIPITCHVVPTWGISLFNSSANVYGSYINISCSDNSVLPDGKLSKVHFCNIEGEWSPMLSECKESVVTVIPITEAPAGPDIGKVSIIVMGCIIVSIMMLDVFTLGITISSKLTSAK